MKTYVAGQDIRNKSTTGELLLVEDTTVEVTPTTYTTSSNPSTDTISTSTSGKYPKSLLTLVFPGDSWYLADDVNFTNLTEITRQSIIDNPPSVTIQNYQLLMDDPQSWGPYIVEKNWVGPNPPDDSIAINNAIMSAMSTGLAIDFTVPTEIIVTSTNKVIGYTGLIKINGKYLCFPYATSRTFYIDQGETSSSNTVTYNLANKFGSSVTGSTTTTTTTQNIEYVVDNDIMSGYNQPSATISTTRSGGDYTIIWGLTVYSISTSGGTAYGDRTTYSCSVNRYEMSNYISTLTKTSKKRRIIRYENN